MAIIKYRDPSTKDFIEIPITEVEANPEEEASEELTSINIGGTNYFITASGGSKAVELTQEEYDELKREGLIERNVIYFIKDS